MLLSLRGTPFILLSASLIIGAATGSAFELTVADRANQIAALLETNVNVVKRPFITFHWEKKNDFNGLSTKSSLLDSSWASALVRKEIGEAFESNFKYGYYVALDPFSTRSYGGTAGEHNWLLIENVMPTGLRYLDLYSRGSDSARREVNSAIRELNCSDGFPNGSQPNSQCRELAQTVLTLLNVDAIKYFYGNVYFERFCPGRDDSAFILLKTAAVDSNVAHVFTYETVTERSERGMIQGVFTAAGKFPDDAVERLWGNIQPDSKPDRLTIDWMHQNLLNCQQ